MFYLVHVRSIVYFHPSFYLLHLILPSYLDTYFYFFGVLLCNVYAYTYTLVEHVWVSIGQANWVRLNRGYSNNTRFLSAQSISWTCSRKDVVGVFVCQLSFNLGQY